MPCLKPHTQMQTTQAIGYYVLVPRGYVVLWHRCAPFVLLEEFIQLILHRTRRWLLLIIKVICKQKCSLQHLNLSDYSNGCMARCTPLQHYTGDGANQQSELRMGTDSNGGSASHLQEHI